MILGIILTNGSFIHHNYQIFDRVIAIVDHVGRQIQINCEIFIRAGAGIVETDIVIKVRVEHIHV
jgi:hypothetical protein